MRRGTSGLFLNQFNQNQFFTPKLHQEQTYSKKKIINLPQCNFTYQKNQ